MAQLKLKFVGALTEFMGEFLDDLVDYPDFTFKSEYQHRAGALWLKLDPDDAPTLIRELEEFREDPDATKSEVRCAGQAIRGIKAASKEAPREHDRDRDDDEDFDEVEEGPDLDETQDLAVDKLLDANTWPVPGVPEKKDA